MGLAISLHICTGLTHVCWEHAAQPAGLQQLRHPCREKQQGPTQRVHGTILTKLPGMTGLHCDTCIKLIAASDTGAAAQPQGRPKTVSDHAERLNLVPGSESVHTCAVDDATIRRCTPALIIQNVRLGAHNNLQHTWGIWRAQRLRAAAGHSRLTDILHQSGSIS